MDIKHTKNNKDSKGLVLYGIKEKGPIYYLSQVPESVNFPIIWGDVWLKFIDPDIDTFLSEFNRNKAKKLWKLILKDEIPDYVKYVLGMTFPFNRIVISSESAPQAIKHVREYAEVFHFPSIISYAYGYDLMLKHNETATPHNFLTGCVWDTGDEWIMKSESGHSSPFLWPDDLKRLDTQPLALYEGWDVLKKMVEKL